MKKISKEKRNQLIITVLVIIAFAAGIWFTLIRAQQSKLVKLDAEKEKIKTGLDRILDAAKHSRQIEAELTVVSNKLAIQEKDMASGDPYLSMVNTIREFKTAYTNLDIPEFASSRLPADMNLLPKFSYKQLTVSVAGTAYYQDLGRFIADFENKYPTSRVLNLEISPATSKGLDEQIAFKMEIVSLVKANETRPAQ